MASRRLLLIALLATLAGIALLPGPARAIIDNPDTLFIGPGENYTLHGLHTYTKMVSIALSGTLFVTPYNGAPGTGTLCLSAPVIDLAGNIDGDGRGWQSAQGPGTGAADGGGGAGHGGAGGASGHSGSGGAVYGTPTGMDIEKGSGGANGWSGSGDLYGGAGGAAITIKAASLSVYTGISANGLPGQGGSWAAGGGSGGGVLICCKQMLLMGSIVAQGGAGGNGTWAGGGGGGGRVKIFSCMDDNLWGSIYVGGGAGGSGNWPGVAGGTGTYAYEYTDPPEILWVKDVRNDQGRQARICWTAACHDVAQASPEVTHYTIWRRVDPLPAGHRVTPAGLRRPEAGLRTAPPGMWDYVATVPARGDPYYSTVVPTLADSTSTGTRCSVFFVSACTDDPFTYYDSPADSGYSVDNIAPETPAPFKGTYLGSSTALHWGASSAPDLSVYQLYRGTSPGFVPGPANLVVAKSDTGYVDAVSGGHCYKLRAVDCNGNPSGYALLTPGQIGGSGESVPSVLWLGRPTPNPARGETAVRFGLPRAGRVSLAVYDLQGRRVRGLIADQLPAGEHAARWDGRTDSGDLSPSGLYFIRLESGGVRVTARVTAIR